MPLEPRKSLFLFIRQYKAFLTQRTPPSCNCQSFELAICPEYCPKSIVENQIVQKASLVFLSALTAIACSVKFIFQDFSQKNLDDTNQNFSPSVKGSRNSFPLPKRVNPVVCYDANQNSFLPAGNKSPNLRCSQGRVKPLKRISGTDAPFLRTSCPAWTF